MSPGPRRARVASTHGFVIAVACMTTFLVLTGSALGAGKTVSRDRFRAAHEGLVSRARSVNSNISTLELEECLWFLVEFMPLEDQETLPVGILVDTVHLALEARYQFPWGLSIPWPIFLNDVLPYATLTEPRDPWRPLFFNYFSSKPVLRNVNTTVAAAVEWMNQFAWNIVSPPIVFNASGNPTGLNEYSPFQVMQAHYASCTGLAIFLVSSLRSIGIPARVAGTPHWNLGNKTCPDGDASPACGNHDWVEVWIDGGWTFVDQRGNIQVNTSWFFPGNAEHQVPNTLNHSIFATSYAPSDYVVSAFLGDNDTLATAVPYFPMVWDWNNAAVPGWDVTLRYLSMLS